MEECLDAMNPKEALIEKILGVPKLVGLIRKQTGPNTINRNPDKLMDAMIGMQSCIFIVLYINFIQIDNAIMYSHHFIHQFHTK